MDGGGGVKVLGADSASCPQAQVEHWEFLMLVLMFRNRAGRGTGYEQLPYLGYRGAIYLPGLTCFC